MKTIVFDTETINTKAKSAGVLPASLANIEMMPVIIEIACIKYDEDFNEIDRLDSLVDPCCEIPAETTAITHIDNDMIVGAPTYAQLFPRLVDFFLGVECVVAHNLNYDTQVIARENKRLGKEYQFPYPYISVDTVKMSQRLTGGTRLKLGLLHKELFGEIHKDAHRAMPDVEALSRCYQELVKRGF